MLGRTTRFMRAGLLDRVPGHALAPVHSQVEREPAPLLSARFVRAYVVTMRPYLLFVSGITGITGLALAARPANAITFILAAVFFLSYGFGQALTDCFQLDTDRLSAPYRPLVSGLIRRGDVMLVSLAGLGVIGLTLSLCHPINIPLAVLAVAGLATYTPFKRRWWAGPFYNAWIVAVLGLIGYTSGLGVADGRAVSGGALSATLAAIFFGYANFVLSGYFKDVSADRAAGYRTLPVAFGLRTSSRASDALALLTVVAAGLAVHLATPQNQTWVGALPALTAFAAGVVSSTLAQARLHDVREEQEAHRAITPVVHAYVLLLSAIALAVRPVWWPWLTVFYFAFVLAMRHRPSRQQI